VETEKADLFTRVIEELMGWVLALMVVLVFGNVVLRYGFNSGIAVSEELSRYLFVVMTFGGAVAGLKRRQHLGMDFLVQKLSGRSRTVVVVAGYLVMLLCCAVLLWGSLSQMKVNQDTRSPVMGMPLSYLYATTAFCGFAMCIMLLFSLSRLVSGRAGPEDLRMASDEVTLANEEVQHVTASLEVQQAVEAGRPK
jgi:TRAP-type C4-dicarboxylate transport system permease small subunit